MFEACSVTLLETFGDDLTVVNAARVSLGKHVDEFSEKDAKLIKYLADHEHTSPFFHPQARFRLRMPIWMAREWFRHTIGFARNEVSRRYVDDEPTFHIPEFRTRAPGKKQGSNDDVHVQNAQFEEFLMSQCRNAVTSYKIMLQNNIPPEQARMVLPQNMMTEFIETGSIAAYARLCHLRLGPDAQKEIRKVAGQVAEQLKSKFPVSWSALTPTPSESLSSAYKPFATLVHSGRDSSPAPSEHIPDVQGLCSSCGRTHDQ
jgi:thymidylate synthase (FAD)